MRGIVHITEPVEYERCGDGIQFTLRSGKERFDFFIERHHARVASADVWRMVDGIERESANVHVLRKAGR